MAKEGTFDESCCSIMDSLSSSCWRFLSCLGSVVVPLGFVLGFWEYLTRGLGTGVVCVDLTRGLGIGEVCVDTVLIFIFGSDSDSDSDCSCWDFSVDGGCELSWCSILIIASLSSTISASRSLMASKVGDCAAGDCAAERL